MEKEMGLHGEEKIGEDGNIPEKAPADNQTADTTADIDSKDVTTTTTTTTTTAEPDEYISGIKLFLVIAAITLVVFLMMLDMSIIVTVCPFPSSCHFSPELLLWSREMLIHKVSRLSQGLLVISTPCRMWDGMGVFFCLRGTLHQFFFSWKGGLMKIVVLSSPLQESYIHSLVPRYAPTCSVVFGAE